MVAPNGHRLRREFATAERDAEIARYWTPDRTCDVVAEHFGINKSTVSRARQRAINAAIVPAGAEKIAEENLKLDELERAAFAVLHSFHVHVADGRIVRDDGRRVEDSKPILMAVDRVLRVAERRARLNGYDAPTKQTIHVITEDVVDQALREAAEEHARLTDADPARSTS